jgi:hypothetical protein
MNFHFLKGNRSESDRAVALVITLIMLAMVTVMAIIFLALARRERGSVKVAEDLDRAKTAAQVAVERAKAQAIATMAAGGSKLSYDLFVSTNFYNYGGFNRNNNGFDPENVSYNYPDGKPLSEPDLLRMLANLQFDPRPPVFVRTNDNAAPDFRFYLDFNRNHLFETNGLQLPILNSNGVTVNRQGEQINWDSLSGPAKFTNSFKFVGDPEWVGVLERPELPHSETNRFLYRYAYIALPVGKALDLNFIHNQATMAGDADLRNFGSGGKSGFNRNQGVGSWEINLAAFFRELNTNRYGWDATTYRDFDLNNRPPKGAAFDDARGILDFRYVHSRNTLAPATQSLQLSGFQAGIANDPLRIAAELSTNMVDDFADGPLDLPWVVPANKSRLYFSTESDDDKPKVDKPGWPGSTSSNAVTDVQQLFTFGDANFNLGLTDIRDRLQQISSKKSSYDRYTYYRLLAQLGVDSGPALKGKIHLNYWNEPGQVANLTQPWTNLLMTPNLMRDLTNRSRWGFFMNAADAMLKATMEKRYETNPVIDGIRFRGVFTNYYIADTKVRSNFSITNIQVYAPPPTNLNSLWRYTGNEYTPTVNRILQVAANVYDSMTNNGAAIDRTGKGGKMYPHYPTTFRPIFTKTRTNAIISGFLEEQTGQFLLNNNNNSTNWLSVSEFLTNNSAPGIYTNINIYGQPVILGAKKGHPNFNELSLETVVEVARKIELVKSAPIEKNPNATNQMFLVDLRNRWGLEGWNSYSNAYNRDIFVHAEVQSIVTVTNFFTNGIPKRVYPSPAVPLTYTTLATNLVIRQTNWVGTTNLTNSLRVFLDNTSILIPSKPFQGGVFRAANPVLFSAVEDPPRFELFTTNRVRFWIYEYTGSPSRAGRLIDYVGMDNLTTHLDLTTNLFSTVTDVNSLFSGGKTTSGKILDNLLWDPTPTNNVTRGIAYQLAISKGEVQTDVGEWRNYRLPEGRDKDAAIDEFRFWMGMPPLSRAAFTPDLGTHHQAPFTPTRVMYQVFSWQVNDPLVHYRSGDLTRRLNSDKPVNTVPGTRLPPWNIGSLNNVYHPWSPSTVATNDPFALVTSTLAVNHMGLQDPGIRRSDDWEFPIDAPVVINNSQLLTNDFFRFPSIGALGRVHRGTPWQTIYLKGTFAHALDRQGRATNIIAFPDPAVWARWSGSIGTYPAGDYKLLDVFTAAPNENAARGLLSVNQENKAAWSAVLSGLCVISNSLKDAVMIGPAGRKLALEDPAKAFTPVFIEPGTSQISNIWAGVQNYRGAQLSIQPTNIVGFPRTLFSLMPKLDSHGVFQHVGEVFGAPELSIESPFLNKSAIQLQFGMRDEVVERIPQQILSLLKIDEPRFVVYAFGQSLKPAPRSLNTSSEFYNICTNYQVTGEFVTKTTFRVEGELEANPKNEPSELRAVIEDFRVLPPPE